MHEVRLPKMGQSVEEASIVTWFKKEGDVVAAGEPLFSIQTDKAEVECESPVSGVLRKILLAPDVIAPVLTLVALVGDATEPLPELGSAGAPATAPTPEPEKPMAAAVPQSAGGDGGRAFASPRAKVLAEKRGVDPAAISGTGPGGRVVEADLLAHAESAKSVRITPTAKKIATASGVDIRQVEGTGIGGKIMKADVAGAVAKPVAVGNQRIPLTKMRSIIAKRMSESKFTAPHYYITVEVDMAAAKKFRAQCSGFTPSFNDLVLCATIRALRDFPQVNAKWCGDAIELLADVNLGVAVAITGGLIVPVLRQAQNLSLEGIASACKTLIDKARTGKLLPDDFTGNSFTVSNLGPFGVDHFTAIINQPDSAILAVGQMKDRPVVVDGGIFVRPIMKLTISSDHRVIDGVVAAQFMGRLKEIIETADF